VKGGGLASLSRAMLLGFVRDRAALIFSILLPVLFLVLFGSLYKNSAVPKISLIAVGRVQLLEQAELSDPGLARVLTITHGRSVAPACLHRGGGRDRSARLPLGRCLAVPGMICFP
jgi:hypothetical protein